MRATTIGAIVLIVLGLAGLLTWLLFREEPQSPSRVAQPPSETQISPEPLTSTSPLATPSPPVAPKKPVSAAARPITDQPPSTATTPVESQYSRQVSGGKCTGQGSKRFARPPMNLDEVSVIIPYGLIVDAHVTPIDHIYFSPAEFNSPRDKYPVFAIADGTIVQISHRGAFVGDQASGKPKSEFRIEVEYSCSFYSYYDLVTSLSLRLAAEVPAERTGHWSKAVRIPITAGEEIGRIGGQTLDWAVYNTEVRLPGLLVPEHYRREPWKIHTDYQAFEYFPDEVKTALYAKLARQAEPRLGKIDYDIDGRAVGNWFLEGTNGYEGVNRERYWDGHLSLLYDYLDPTQIRFSIGNFGGASKQFGVKNNGPDPATITTETGPVKYELMFYEHYNKDTNQPWRSNTGPISNPGSRLIREPQGVALIELIEPRKLKVEVFPGKAADQVSGFTIAAQLYER